MTRQVATEAQAAAAPPSAGALTWAARPGARKVLAAARAKLEAGRTGDTVTVPADLSADERDDVTVLLGLPWHRTGRPATLGQLRRALRAGARTELEALLEATSGRLRDLRAEREHDAERARAALQAARARIEAAGVPAAVAAAVVPRVVPLELAPVAAEVLRFLRARSSGWGGADKSHGADAAVEANARVGLARLAHDVTGDAHALDRDQALGRAIVRTLAALQEYADDHATVSAKTAAEGCDSLDAGPYPDFTPAAPAVRAVRAVVVPGASVLRRAAIWRAVWARAGVDCDMLSAVVLVLGVHLDGDGPAARQSRSAPGEPLWLTAGALADGGWRWPDDVTVRVCENPSVVEAAKARLGAACPPLVCTYGHPSTAAVLLLAGLRGTHRVQVSTDRDVAGLRIAAAVPTMAPHAASVTAWLPDAPGLYEESRIDVLLADLSG